MRFGGFERERERDKERKKTTRIDGNSREIGWVELEGKLGAGKGGSGGVWEEGKWKSGREKESRKRGKQRAGRREFGSDIDVEGSTYKFTGKS